MPSPPQSLPNLSISRIFLFCAAVALVSTIFIFIEILSPPPPSAGAPLFVIAFGPSGSGKSSSALRRDLFARLLPPRATTASSRAHRDSFVDISVDALVEGSASFQSRMRALVASARYIHVGEGPAY